MLLLTTVVRCSTRIWIILERNKNILSQPIFTIWKMLMTNHSRDHVYNKLNNRVMSMYIQYRFLKHIFICIIKQNEIDRSYVNYIVNIPGEGLLCGRFTIRQRHWIIKRWQLKHWSVTSTAGVILPVRTLDWVDEHMQNKSIVFTSYAKRFILGGSIFSEIQILYNVEMKFITIAVWIAVHHVHHSWTCIGYTMVHAYMSCKRPLYFLIFSL
jgi:hypothetical protein